MTQKHTALPWSWRSETDKDYPKDYDLDNIVNSEGKYVLSIYGNQSKRKNPDYAFIVRACNSHYELLEALNKILHQPNNTISDGKALEAIIKIARSAIEKAEGK